MYPQGCCYSLVQQIYSIHGRNAVVDTFTSKTIIYHVLGQRETASYNVYNLTPSIYYHKRKSSTPNFYYNMLSFAKDQYYLKRDFEYKSEYYVLIKFADLSVYKVDIILERWEHAAW